jgi:hypothetical protein
MGQLSQDVINKVAGAAWDSVREKFLRMTETLLNVAPDAQADMTTIYVKFTVTAENLSPVYAVAWIKNSKRWVTGLALPGDFEDPRLGPAPPQKKYTGLTKYFTVTPEDNLPEDLSEWAKLAHQRVVAENEG